MKRIIMHWTAGAYKASSLDKQHYHFIIEDDGKVVKGVYPVSANAAPIKGKYAAHTLNCNSDSIGVSMACMAGAVEGKTNGKYPMTEKQFEAMCKLCADLCKSYNIAVKPETVLSHAEIQTTLKIKQRGKWDFTVLPFQPMLKGHRPCGDYARARVQYYLDLMTPKPTMIVSNHVAEALTTPKPKPVQPKTFWQRVTAWFGGSRTT